MQTFLAALVRRFEALEEQLNALDSAIGDGDHGSTILKGLKAAAAADDGVAKAFRTTAGGASGMIFSLVLAAIEKSHTQNAPLGEALAAAAVRISQVGQAKQGDKTMLDALIPAANGATANPGNASLAAAEAAREGALATKDMEARRGRAKYIEGRGAGHVDPGAMSVAEILEEYHQQSGGTA